MKKSSQSKRLAKKREKERRHQTGDSNYENNAMEEVMAYLLALIDVAQSYYPAQTKIQWRAYLMQRDHFQ